MPHRVIIGLPRWQHDSSSVFTERLVRGLMARGREATVIITESGLTSAEHDAGSLQATPPADLPCEILAVGAQDSWGQRWEALERYLEERAPCHYLMLHDLRHNVIAPRLSRRIKTFGVLLHDSEPLLQQAFYLFPYWDAVVATDEHIHYKLLYLHGSTSKLGMIPQGIPMLASAPIKERGNLLIACILDSELRVSEHNDLVAILSELATHAFPFRLTIFGAGLAQVSLSKELQPLIERGLLAVVGRFSNEDLLDALADHHAVLSTARESAALPLSLVEAMSRGCIPLLPWMSSAAGLITHGTNALIGTTGNLDDFVAQLERLAYDPDWREHLGKKAFETVRSAGLGIEPMVERYVGLFERMEEQSRSHHFIRPRRSYVALQEEVAGQIIFSGSTIADQHYISATDPWPDPPAISNAAASFSSSPSRSARLRDHRILVACSGGSISGVDTFSVHLVRGLRRHGIDARILTRPADQDGNPISFADDIPLELKDSRLESNYLSWKLRWQIMRKHLESLGPCIYLPNYDDRYSCLAPVLSNDVRIVGIAHSDDPWHYEHLCRIGHACDALVGVSHAITEHLRGLAPAFASRVETIPYGIPHRTALEPAWNEDISTSGKRRLRIIYTGRLIPRQKRVLDLLAIARALDKRAVLFEMIIVGDGDLRYAMERQAHQLVRERKIWFTGAQPHDDAMAILAMGDVFLLPSAFEGLSVGMLEAMAQGLVPVVSDLRSGVPDVIVAGCNGLVARVGDCEGFADHLQWLWLYPEDRRRMGQAAADSVSKTYLIEPMIDRYMALFQKIVDNPYPRQAGAIVPPAHILPELKLSTWAARIAADPGQSMNRVMKRLFQSGSE